MSFPAGAPTWATLGALLLTSDGRDGSQSVDQFIDHLGALAALGIDESIVSLSNFSDPDAFAPRSEVVRQAALITPAGR